MICADPKDLCCMLSFMEGLKPVDIKCIEPTALNLQNQVFQICNKFPQSSAGAMSLS